MPECSSALFALERLVACVQPTVDAETVYTTEPLTTDFTLEWFFSRMHSHVDPSFTVAAEFLRADLALEGLLPGMDRQMYS